MGTPNGLTSSVFPESGNEPSLDYIESRKETKEPPHQLDQRYFRMVKSHIRHGRNDKLLDLVKRNPDRRVNLMEDTLLHIVIACGKTDLAKSLIGQMGAVHLKAKSWNGDTPLHVAAAVGDCEVATELVRNNKEIIRERNLKLETPLHKAALYGQRDMFWCLIEEDNDCFKDRREDGATVLHCAIMGNAPSLALEIARQYPELITSRNADAVAPLQLMVTIPGLFRSQMALGSLESFLFRLIPLEEDSPKSRDGDEEAPKSTDRADVTEEIEEDDYEDLERPRRIRSKFPSQYRPLFDLLELMYIPARWIQLLLFNILMQLSPRIRRLEGIKRTHRAALQLIEYLVHKEEYVDFFNQGTGKGKDHAKTSNDNRVAIEGFEHPAEATGERHRERGGRRDQLVIAFAEKFFRFASHGDDRVTEEELRKCMQDAIGALSPESTRWNEPPLILGAQMGLPEYVRTILKVSPQAATYLDTKGRSVLQVAIEHGNLEIVETIREMTEGHNPILPSWLLSCVDGTTGGTILHFASAKGPDNYQDAMQMQDELRWFETVRHMVPKELVNYRNNTQKTAQEIFTESHQDMLKNCKDQLMEMGKTCSSLVAAVVFASSFSIPGEKDPATGNPVYFNRLPFKIFSHAYVIGLSSAATSLVLFLSLVISPYKQQQFRRAIPAKYFFACLSFGVALMAFLVSFTCNIFLQIYGGQRSERKDLIPLLLELMVFPFVCVIVLLYRGSSFGPSFARLWR
ncbi:unnamed protein product [Musa acuminata subsp. burmannicoides]